MEALADTEKFQIMKTFVQAMDQTNTHRKAYKDGKDFCKRMLKEHPWLRQVVGVCKGQNEEVPSPVKRPAEADDPEEGPSTPSPVKQVKTSGKTPEQLEKEANFKKGQEVNCLKMRIASGSKKVNRENARRGWVYARELEKPLTEAEEEYLLSKGFLDSDEVGAYREEELKMDFTPLKPLISPIQD